MAALETRNVVLVTGDQVIIEVVQRHAAVVGLEVLLVSSPGVTRSAWAQASLVLIGADSIDQLSTQDFARRAGVIVVAGPGIDEQPLWRLAVEVGAEHVASLPLAESWLLQRLSEVADGPVRNGSLIVVTSASGGCGVSTLAACLAAIAVQQGQQTVLIDGDRHSGGLDLLIGGERAQGVRWPDLAHTTGRLSATTLSYALPRVQGMSFLSHSRAQVTAVSEDALQCVLDAARRGFDRIVVDLPRLVSPSALLTADVVVLVVPATLRGIAGGRQALSELEDAGITARLVTRRASRGLAVVDVERALGATAVHALPEVSSLALRAEHGDAFDLKDAYGRSVRDLSQRLLTAGVAA